KGVNGQYIADGVAHAHNIVHAAIGSGYLFFDPFELTGQSFPVIFKRLDLIGIIPPEDITRAIINPMSVVFFMPAPLTFRLTLAGERLGFTLEIFQSVAAKIIEPPRQFLLKPIAKDRVCFYV